MSDTFTRRRFMGTTAAAGCAMIWAQPSSKPALLGGTPVRTRPFPSWPVFGAPEEQELLKVLRSAKWFRGSGKEVAGFETAFARMTGSRHCLATANGTSALLTSLNALDVQAGDEVILPPYTFVATLNVVLLQYALPIFVDTDAETFQIDPRKIEPAITERTKVLLPVHIGGSLADLDSIMRIAQKRQLPVLEDACQAHLAEWKDRKAGAVGTLGCFSFQASKNLNSGEGGAILTDSDELIEKCYAFHNNSRGRRSIGYNFTYQNRGANLRMTEFQGGLLQAQMTRLTEQCARRDQNAAYLTQLLKEIRGFVPARVYDGCTRNAYHLYMARYHKEEFAGMPRSTFLKALSAEGIPCSGGYSPLNKEPYIQTTLQSRGYRAIYPKNLLDQWAERTACPVNDKLCEEAVWFTQNMLVGEKSDMEQITAAIAKIKKHAPALAGARPGASD